MRAKQHDEGFSLIEMLLVVVVLGILATIVAVSVGGFTAEAEDSGCRSDAYILSVAVESYFAQQNTGVIPAADTGPDGFEKTLVSAEFLRSPSTLHNLTADGRLVPVADSPCTV